MTLNTAPNAAIIQRAPALIRDQVADYIRNRITSMELPAGALLPTLQRERRFLAAWPVGERGRPAIQNRRGPSVDAGRKSQVLRHLV